MTKKVQQLIDTMHENREQLGTISGFKMDYTPQSLKKMEKSLDDMFGNRELRPETVGMLGAYLGEVIQKKIEGAKWVDYVEYVFEAHLLIPMKGQGGDIRFNPFTRIEMFMKDHTDTLYGMYGMLQDMSKGRLDVGESVDKGVIKGTSPRGYSYKVTAVSPELYARHEKGEITQEEMMKLAEKEADERKG